jgi:predicted transcriptional regulator
MFDFFLQERICSMGRSRNDQRLDEILAAIQRQPDRIGSICARLGLDNKTAQRALIQMEDRGDLLAEDDNGIVSWFGKRK